MQQRLALGCVLQLLQRRQRRFLLPPSPLHQGPAVGLFRSDVRQRRVRGQRREGGTALCLRLLMRPQRLCVRWWVWLRSAVAASTPRPLC
jgi:hypothetical protein